MWSLVPAARGPASRAGGRHPAERVVRPDARVVSGRERRVCGELEVEDRPGRHHQPVAWRIGQAGPRGHRRFAGRHRDPRARVRHRRDPGQWPPDRDRTGRRGCRRTAARTRRPSCCSYARATRRASRTGTTWSARVCRSSRRIRRPPVVRAGTTWRRGGTRSNSQRGTRRARVTSWQALSKRARARLRRPRLDDDVRAARHRRRARRMGERGPARGGKAREG